MREIKFRAWDEKLQSMSPYCTLSEWMAEALDQADAFATQHHEEMKRYFGLIRFMQYTGFKDKNGIEIYEGDILFNSLENKRYEVKWDNGRWFADGDYLHSVWASLCKVIGNIYENPELLQPEEATTALGQHDEDEEGQIDEMRLNNDL